MTAFYLAVPSPRSGLSVNSDQQATSAEPSIITSARSSEVAVIEITLTRNENKQNNAVLLLH